MKVKTIFSLALLFSVAYANASEEGLMHAVAMHNHQSRIDGPGAVRLSEAGSDAYGTIQEVISRLYRNPNTDWSQVDLEALRRHLIDMNAVTLDVAVLSQHAIPGGLEVVIEPQTGRAAAALGRILKMHHAQLERDSGWRMKVINGNGQYTLITTTQYPEEADEIRGLGYIGLMAYGDHHQRHHWAIATGSQMHHH